MRIPPPVILHPDDVCHCLWALDDNHIRGCTNTDCGCLIHCVDEDGSVCWSVGPHGARCDIRRGHIGAHGGIDQTGTWRQWT